jgi:hypothetical protein
MNIGIRQKLDDMSGLGPTAFISIVIDEDHRAIQVHVQRGARSWTNSCLQPREYYFRDGIIRIKRALRKVGYSEISCLIISLGRCKQRLVILLFPCDRAGPCFAGRNRRQLTRP